MTEKHRKVIRGAITLTILVGLITAIFLILYKNGVFQGRNTVERIRQLIESHPAYSYLIYMLIQYLQVVVLPIPAAITTTAGVIIFGAWPAFWLSYFSCMLGAITAFFIGRSLGKKVIEWIVGEADMQKWSKKLAGGRYTYFLMMLFPIFPDDILCFIVGTTDIKFNFFLFTNILTRAIGIGATCFITSGSVIPFEGWGIPVLVILAILMLIALFLSFKYESKIEIFFRKIERRIKIIFNKNKESD